ncbi:serine/threonine protein kinase [Myxococcota bacterium]|nr:serine/threonine protein kinase [Myxococcota bacterium]
MAESSTLGSATLTDGLELPWLRAGRLTDAAPGAAVDEPGGERIADRYRTFERLGQGANGRVYRAVDRISGEHVAVKLVPAPTARELERVRAEVTALRWLRLPGVAALRDDGLEGDEYFVVMDLVRGRPFLGPRRQPWEQVAQGVLAFLENLARVHLAGVVHRDLKPANVLVDELGQPVIVDLGLARGRALSEDWNRSGTPRYVAPEQALGEACGPQADLYSLGVMLYEALSGGFLPQPVAMRPGVSPKDILAERVHSPPRPLAEVAPGVPAAVVAVVDRLVARDPAGRPASALEVLQALGGRPPVALSQTLRQVLDGRRQASPRALRLLFAGPDHFQHLREDAAQVLWERTGGHAPTVADEIHAWVEAGLCTWEGALLRIDRVAIERLRVGVPLAVAPPPPPTLSLDALLLLEGARRAWPDTTPEVLAAAAGLEPPRVTSAAEELVRVGLCWWLSDGRLGLRPIVLPATDPAERAAQAAIAAHLPADSDGRLRHLVASDAPPSLVLPAAHRVVERLAREGQHPRALAVLELALSIARRDPALAPHEEALLVAWARLALALYEVGRSRARSPQVLRVEELLYAWRVCFTAEPERCRGLAARLAPFEDEVLETWRATLDYAAARMVSLPAVREVLVQLEPWAAAGGAGRRSSLANWQSYVAYATGDFPRAARLRLQVAEAAASADKRLAALTSAAFALLDGGDLDGARRVAGQAQDLAQALRHPLLEARAACVLRQADYRGRRARAPEPERVEAARGIHAWTMAQLALVEAGFALRLGERALSLSLARAGADGFRSSGFPAGALLLDALAFATGPSPAEERGRALVTAAAELPDPSLALQVLGLVRLCTQDRCATAADVELLARSARVADPDRIIDLLSLQEARAGHLEPWASTPLLADAS